MTRQTKLALIVPIYIFVYALAAMWTMIDGWLSGFANILSIWSVSDVDSVHSIITFLLFTMVGSVLGCAVLGIISFHRYYAIEKSFDDDHIWGFLFAPLLALIIGVLVYAIIQSGLVVLSGNVANPSDPNNASLGYLSIGCVAGYNWDVFARKLQELSKNILNNQ
ncbi:hypothetical protein Q6U63_003271 [Vibrio fluvialis]|nr:hypothetical protein [Vibrio fluvialis]